MSQSFDCAPPIIDSVDTFILDLPVRGNRRHGSGDIAGSIRNLFVRVEADGMSGWGEAAPWPVFTGTVESARAAVDSYLAPLLVGQPGPTPRALIEIMDRALVGHPEAKAAVEMAMLDLTGHLLGVSASDLIGGALRDRIQLSVSLADPDTQADLALAESLYEEGIRLFKIKTGFLEHRDELRRLDAFARAMPSDTRLRVDYNQGLSPYRALRELKDLDIFNFDFIEQPVARPHIKALSELRAKLQTPVQADESVFSAVDAMDVCHKNAADSLSLKVMKSGGILNTLEVAAIASANGIACYGGDMFESGLAHSAGMHLLCAIPDLELGCEFYQARYHLLADPLAEPFPIHEGYVYRPKGHGLGVTVDPDVVAHYSVN